MSPVYARLTETECVALVRALARSESAVVAEELRNRRLCDDMDDLQAQLRELTEELERYRVENEQLHGLEEPVAGQWHRGPGSDGSKPSTPGRYIVSLLHCEGSLRLVVWRDTDDWSYAEFWAGPIRTPREGDG